MARFAGDFFGIPLSEEADEGSDLLKRFPELRNLPKTSSESQEGARSIRSTKAAPVFAGFKTFQS